jgi:thiamine biosynthesis lipoprotein
LIDVTAAIATSGNYERPGHLIVPSTGRAARGVGSATVTGPELDLVDALATGLAVGGRAVLEAIDGLAGYEAYLITDDGNQYATAGMAFVGQLSRA